MNDSPAPERMWTTAETAEFLQVPVKTLYRWIEAGEGPPSYRLGRGLRFYEAEVKAWVTAKARAT